MDLLPDGMLPNPPRLRALAARRALLWATVAGLLCVLLAHAVAQVLQPEPQRLLQTARQRYGQGGAQRVQSWFDMLARGQNVPESEKIRVVNQFWNQAVIGVEDIVVWKQVDYWATPLESLGKQRGDCEDYVIGKYFSLLNLGVDGNKLRFIYVKARTAGVEVAHMVLGYYSTPNAMPLVLDNLIGTIEPASNRRDLVPVFSFNASGVYVEGRQASPIERIGRWNDLLARMRREGFH